MYPSQLFSFCMIIFSFSVFCQRTLFFLVHCQFTYVIFFMLKPYTLFFAASVDVAWHCFSQSMLTHTHMAMPTHTHTHTHTHCHTNNLYIISRRFLFFIIEKKEKKSTSGETVRYSCQTCTALLHACVFWGGLLCLHIVLLLTLQWLSVFFNFSFFFQKLSRPGIEPGSQAWQA